MTGAVSLSNGKVLTAGVGQCHPEAVCWELYDPVLNVWMHTGQTEGAAGGDFGPPQLQTLNPLTGGGALVTFWEFGSPTDVKKYRYTASGFVALPPAVQGQRDARNLGHTATLLDHRECERPNEQRSPAYRDYPCGKVLLAGGVNNTRGGVKSDGNEQRTAELYSYDANNDKDPGKLLPLAIMPEGRRGHGRHAAALLDDGRVLLISGDSKGTNHRDVDFFDPSGGDFDPTGRYRMGSWSAAASLPDLPPGASIAQNRWAERLRDGRVLMGGGAGDPPMVFDPTAGAVDAGTGKPIGSWTPIGRCPDVDDCGVPAVLPDGSVLTVGSYRITPGALKASVLDTSDVDAKKWAWTPVVPDPAVPALTATLLDGNGDPTKCGTNCGNVLVAGGVGTEFVSTGAAQLFQPLRLEGLSVSSGFACGGTKTLLSGNGFHDIAAVNFGAEKVLPASSDNPSGFTVRDNGKTISLTTPRHPPGAVAVTVTTKGGATAAPNAEASFTYKPVVPATVGKLSPPEGRADGETPVTIEGSFVPDCVRSVRFGGRSVDYALDASNPGGKITTTSPGGAPGQVVQVTVGVDPGPPAGADPGLASLASTPGAADFTYLALPGVMGVNPPAGSALGGARVTITGSGFEEDGDARPKVFFDGHEALGVTVAPDNKTITATLPPLAPDKVPGGNFSVSVSTARRGTSLPFTSFTYHPGVRGIFPSSGFTTGGESRTITGVGLRIADKVLIGGEEATILDRPADQDALVVRTPARAAPESVRVEVIVAGLVSLEPIFFTYGDPPPSPADPGNRDTGITPGQREPVVQVAPPGGTGSPAPGASPTATPSASPGGSGAASASASASASPGASGSPGQGASATHAQASAGAAGIAPAPAPGPAAAPAQATPGSGGAPGSGQAGLGGEDERGEVRHAPRHNMTAANMGLGLGAAGAAMCFSGLALARRRRSARSRPRPRGAY